MLVPCGLAGLSALETYYARIGVGTQFGAPIASGDPRSLFFCSSGRAGLLRLHTSPSAERRDRSRPDTKARTAKAA
jgi:hypothetical protein